MSDYSRALVHVLTGGAEGRTPHFVSDTIACLAARGRTVVLKALISGPVRMHIVVDDRDVFVREAEVDGDGCKWFFATHGNCAVRFKALRYIRDVPTTFYNSDGVVFDPFEPLYNDWTKRWAKPAHRGIEQYLATLGVARCSGLFSLPYVSEFAIGDAIDLVLSAPSFRRLTPGS